jgi:hypothetical protein
LATTGNNRMDPSWTLPIKADCSLLWFGGEGNWAGMFAVCTAVGQEPGFITIPFSKEQRN